MKNFRVVVLLAVVVALACVGGATKLRYTEMPDITGTPRTAGIAVLDIELGLDGYKSAPTDGPYTTRCWIVRQGAEDKPIEVAHNFGFFVFQNLEPGRYAVSRVEWSATFWIKDIRDAESRKASGETSDEVPHNCKFVYTFVPFKSDKLQFDIQAEKITYTGVLTINEPAEFAITHGSRPASYVEREDYADNVTYASQASYEKRALEELYLQNANTPWGDIIQSRLQEIEPE
jgi:hypothetical protein